MPSGHLDKLVVTRLSKSTSVSTTPVRPGKSHPLSPLDHSMARHTVHFVFYYRASPAMGRELLLESVSELLAFYPSMTGRLTRGDKDGDGGWVIKCNDAGVRTIVARVSGTLDEWFAFAGDEDEAELAYFEPMSSDPYLWSPFYLQITEFQDGAFALGLSASHLLVDATAAAIFFRSWADCHRRRTLAFPPFLHAPAFLRPNPDPDAPAPPFLAHKPAAAAGTTADDAMSSATFVFPAAAVRRLLEDLNAAENVTPFAALVALFWIRARTVGGLQLCPADIAVAVDYRKRLQAPLPTGYFGNAVHFSHARVDLAAGTGHVAEEIARHLVADRETEMWSAVEYYHRALRGRGELEAAQMYGPEFTCVALDHVPIGSAEFEEGKGPVQVGFRIGGAVGEGLVAVMAGGDGEEGRSVVVTLPKKTVREFCRDETVLSYGPKVLFGPKN